jgi:uncharacterized protein (TIGR01777 family)
MKILVTGGTGFIGKELVKLLRQHRLTILTRDSDRAKSSLQHSDFGNIQYIETLDAFNDLNNFDAVINLAGEGIADKRWSKKRKQILCESRWSLTEKIINLINKSSNPPSTLISGSAVGYYGDQQQNDIDENTPPDKHSFTHYICDNWEKLTHNVNSEKTRVCTIRTGVVLGKDGGMLAKLLPTYKLGIGGPIGDGKQYLPWVHMQDMINAIHYLLVTESAKGPFNICAPHPVQFAKFSLTLAHQLKRPHFAFVPAWTMKLMLGESSALVLDSIKAKPMKLTKLGFNFTFPRHDLALKHLLTK